MVVVEEIVVGPIETNCYLVSNERQEALIIDPGAEAEKIISRINDRNLKPVAVINTHGHYDHVLANMAIKHKYAVPVFFPAEDKYLIALNQKLYAINEGFQVDKFYQDEIKIKGFKIQIIHTPGHTKGSSCLLIGNKLFSGDMLFAEGYLGRTDLWGGSEQEIKSSLKKLLALPDNTDVYPGHGPVTIIGREREYHER